MVEMELNKIIIDEKRQDQIIVLKEKNGDKLLPIIIGFVEASAIKMKIGGQAPPRPMTHDLIQGIIAALQAEVKRIVIDKLENNTFHAKIFLINKDNGSEHAVDARPSDSIALAVRVNSPIFVEEEVIKRAEIFNQE